MTKDRRQVFCIVDDFVADDFLECCNDLLPFTLGHARRLKKNVLVPLNGDYPGNIASCNKTKEEFGKRKEQRSSLH